MDGRERHRLDLQTNKHQGRGHTVAPSSLGYSGHGIGEESTGDGGGGYGERGGGGGNRTVRALHSAILSIMAFH